MFKKQMPRLALDQNRNAIDEKIVVGGAGRPKFPHGIAGERPAAGTPFSGWILSYF